MTYTDKQILAIVSLSIAIGLGLGYLIWGIP